MGLLDRTFGVDKNSTIYTRLAFHWRMVSSHYENYPKKNDISKVEKDLMEKIHKKSDALAGEILDSIKGFGVISAQRDETTRALAELNSLYCESTITTDKHHWLPELVIVTKEILSGNRRPYQNSQYWFSN